MKTIRAFFDSMTGRVFLILVLGIGVAGSSALFLTDAWRRADLDRARLERAVDRMQGFVTLIGRADETARAELLQRGSEGVRVASADAAVKAPDPRLEKLLNTQLTGAAVSKLSSADPAVCFASRPRGPGGGPGGRDGGRGPQFGDARSPGGPGRSFGGDGRGRQTRPPGCWVMDLALAQGGSLRLTLDIPPSPVSDSRAFDPVFLTVLTAASALLAFVLAAMTGSPLRNLAEAARNLGRDLNREPLAETGPREVRAAAQAFNAMQLRLRQNMAERTQMLAAITHDLQTPLTRLRLRLEKVKDEALRDQLIGDLVAMQGLIREGLDLARSADRDEPTVTLDLDSLLESIIEDEASAGREVTFVQRCGRDVAVQTGALKRCLLNLIDNAVVYGHKAEVSAAPEGENIVIRIRDQGPGIPADKLEAVFEPLVRLEGSRSRETGGSGLGLSIARRLAEKNGGTLVLTNHPYGGCEAVLTLPGQLR